MLLYGFFMPQFLLSMYWRNGGTLNHTRIISAMFTAVGVFLSLVVLIILYLLKPWAIYPYGPHNSEGGKGLGWNHFEQLQLFLGGNALPIVLAVMVVYVIVATSLHSRHFQSRKGRTFPKLPLEPGVPMFHCGKLALLLTVLIASFWATTVFGANFHWPPPNLYFESSSPYALANWKLSTRFVAKIYDDTLVFYGVLVGVVLAGALAHTSPTARRLLHSRIRVPLVGLKYHPYPHGVTVGELFLASVVVFLYAYWLYYFRYAYKRIEVSAIGDPHKALQVWARVFGNIANLSFALLLLPAARNSMWVSCFGVPFERAVKHHRALGVVAYLSVTIHLFIWVGKWAAEGTLGNNLFNPVYLQIQPEEYVNRTTCVAKWTSSKPHFDNFTILPAWIGWVLLTAMLAIAQLCRRKNYELFYYTHHFAWVYYIIALMHSWGLWFYACGGLVLYAIDRSIRLTRGCCAGGAVRLQERDGVTIVRFSVAPLAHFAGQYAFVNVPDISLLQWHPFTISSPPTQPLNERELTFHIKDMGPGTWTHALCELGKAGATVEVKVDGPYGMPVPFSDRGVLVLVAGGIGITPMISLFADIYNRVSMSGNVGSIQVRAAVLHFCVSGVDSCSP